MEVDSSSSLTWRSAVAVLLVRGERNGVDSFLWERSCEARVGLFGFGVLLRGGEERTSSIL